MPYPIDAKCRKCRREGVKLFLKGDRCFSEKCAMNRKPYPPGRTSAFGSRPSTYSNQLHEKQKVKRMYGLSETQLRNIYLRAGRFGGDRALKLLQLIEMRLGNVIYMLGIAPSRSASRQVVSHGKISVNGKKVTISSYVTRIGDTIEVRDPKLIVIPRPAHKMPAWLKPAGKGGTVVSEPTRDMIDENINESAIIEFYSR